MAIGSSLTRAHTSGIGAPGIPVRVPVRWIVESGNTVRAR